MQYYNLRIANLVKFAKVIGSKYGENILVFRASHLWNQVPDLTDSTLKQNLRENGKLLNVHALVADK